MLIYFSFFPNTCVFHHVNNNLFGIMTSTNENFIFVDYTLTTFKCLESGSKGDARYMSLLYATRISSCLNIYDYEINYVFHFRLRNNTSVCELINHNYVLMYSIFELLYFFDVSLLNSIFFHRNTAKVNHSTFFTPIFRVGYNNAGVLFLEAITPKTSKKTIHLTIKMDSIDTNTQETLNIDSTTPFETLSLPTSLFHTQCVAYKHEILICGGQGRNKCYSYHAIKNQYKEICSYPNDVRLDVHCVVKRVNENNPNEIILLSFGGSERVKRHTLIMKYTSVWKEDQNDIANIKQVNKWIPFTDNNDKPVLIGRDKENHRGARGVIGGSNNHLLFITHFGENIDVFNLNTFQYIKRDTLPVIDCINYHCFILKTTNKLGYMKRRMKKNEMLLFQNKTGLSIEYDEDNNTFQCNDLPVCDDIASFSDYAYVYINDTILFFGGWNGGNGSDKIISNAIHKYSIKEKTWTTFEHTLPIPSYYCSGILSEDNTYIHIIGGSNGDGGITTHLRTKVNIWTMNGLDKKEKDDEIKRLQLNDNVNSYLIGFCIFILLKINQNKKDNELNVYELK
ncbi:hypothetical protein RFI_28321 [Reticulomyxa filosa]|uniref:Kelch motif family protein n=1 Tax=Reticulomyxa filosa TaxID=46433 RepID=X6M581_RETFI|nr:hypothetical protein RFI_28321 [Reticulomyxa filosa]|eukprot:ETO09069.1 hypothetical protein RFI_28321 [Reticulomyxa filosa]